MNHAEEYYYNKGYKQASKDTRLKMSDLKVGEGMILRNTENNRALREDIKEGELYIDVRISKGQCQEFKLKEIWY